MDALGIFAYSFAILLILVSTAFLLFAAKVYMINRKYGHLPSPKTDSFFLGHVTNMNRFKEKFGMGLIPLSLQWMHDKGPVIYLRFVIQPLIMCADADTTKTVLLDSRHKKQREMYQFFHSVFGERFMGWGLVSETNHELWKVKRAIMNPAFKRTYLMFMMEQFNDSAERLCSTLYEKADGKTQVSMLDALNDVALNVIAKAGFNLEADTVKSYSESSLSSVVGLTLAAMNRTFSNPFLLVDPRKKARSYRKSVRDACKLVRRIGKECIEERLAAQRRGDELPHDILQCILNNKDDFNNEELEEMVDEFTTFFMAGQETTSNLMAFALQHIGRQEKVAKRLVKEVDEVLGQKPVIEYSDLAKMEYMTQVLKETLRLTPSVSGSSRILSFDVNCNGYRIPKGASLTLMFILSALREEYFDDPLLFNPDRFAPGRDRPRHLFAYAPFSVGQRNCIGQHLALIEAKVVLAKLFQRFNICLDQSQRFTILDEVTNKPLDGCKSYVSLR